MAIDNNNSNIRVCPSCNKLASWNSHFQRYICPYCGWEGTEMPKTKKKSNIDYVYCDSPENIIWWIETRDKDHISSHGFFYTAVYTLEKLKDASQIISVSYDQSHDMYLVVFRVEEE